MFTYIAHYHRQPLSLDAAAKYDFLKIVRFLAARFYQHSYSSMVWSAEYGHLWLTHFLATHTD